MTVTDAKSSSVRLPFPGVESGSAVSDTATSATFSKLPAAIARAVICSDGLLPVAIGPTFHTPVAAS